MIPLVMGRTKIALLLAGLNVGLARGDGLGGGGDSHPPHDGPHITAEERVRVDAQLREFAEKFGPLSVSRGAAPELFRFYPQAGTLYGDLFINNFNDLNAGPGILDFACRDFTYDGHDATDVDLRGFGEQEIGVPVVAAQDGVVVATNDGEFDMNTCGNGPCSNFANYVIVDHGAGRLCYYWHLKNGSVSVNVGQNLRAGERLGLTASSGFSTAPHLHFATYQNGQRYEPFAGSCRPGASGWLNQPAVPLALYARDFGLTHENLGLHPGWPHYFPRAGQIALADPQIYVWVMLQNQPANSTWRLRFIRPNNTVALDSGNVGFNNPFYRASWWWWNYNVTDMHTILGTWRVELRINGQVIADAPIEVRTQRTSDFNRPPAGVTLDIEPASPTPADVLIARIQSDLIFDDPDYDLLRYDYSWWINGLPYATATTAAHSDILPRGSACAADVVACQVVPRDASLSGPTAVDQITIPGSPTPGDLDGDLLIRAADGALASACMFGPGGGLQACCRPGDLSADGDVDLLDLAEFQREAQ